MILSARDVGRVQQLVEWERAASTPRFVRKLGEEENTVNANPLGYNLDGYVLMYWF